MSDDEAGLTNSEIKALAERNNIEPDEFVDLLSSLSHEHREIVIDLAEPRWDYEPLLQGDWFDQNPDWAEKYEDLGKEPLED